MISWSAGPSLVEFGITSEVGPYFSSMFVGATETRLEVRQKTSLMRKHSGMDFPPCLSCLCWCCYERVGSQPMKAWRGGRQEEATSFSFCLIPCPLYKTQLSSFCQRPQCAETGPTAVCAFGKDRKGLEQKSKLAKKHETEANKILPIYNVTAASCSASFYRFV